MNVHNKHHFVTRTIFYEFCFIRNLNYLLQMFSKVSSNWNVLKYILKCVSHANKVYSKHFQVKTEKGHIAELVQFRFFVGEATVGMFDWRLFDNSNRTKVVQQPKKLGCLTQIMFDSDYVRRKIDSCRT